MYTIRHRPGRELLVPDMLSRPFGDGGLSYQPPGSEDDNLGEVEYIPPEKTMAALEAVALNLITPEKLAQAQQECPDVKLHKEGKGPSNVKMQEVLVSNIPLYCEISVPGNPRPLVPSSCRDIIVNLLHHQDHAGQKETVSRVAKDYYWPALRKNVEDFVKTCHPCQSTNQTPTIDPGVSRFPVPDQRFSFIHVDVVGPLPPSEGMRFLLGVAIWSRSDVEWSIHVRNRTLRLRGQTTKQ